MITPSATTPSICEAIAPTSKTPTSEATTCEAIAPTSKTPTSEAPTCEAIASSAMSTNYVAYIGIDWADRKHDIALYDCARDRWEDSAIAAP